MKILHVGGQHCVTSAITKYQTLQGHEAAIIGSPSGSFLDRFVINPRELSELRAALSSGNYDLIQLHQADTLADIATQCADSGGLCKVFLNSDGRGPPLTFFSYGTESSPPVLTATDGTFLGDSLHGLFRHVFIGNGTTLGLEKREVPWSWLPIPIDLESIPTPEPLKLSKTQPLRVTHISLNDGGGEDSELINETVAKLAEQNYLFEFKMISRSSFDTGWTIQDAIGGCDLLIEQVHRNSFGVLALLSMAHGKTVISCNQYGIGESWNNLQFSPVIDSNPKTFRRKLEAVIREPICLKDLSMRSRAYVERYHRCEVIVAKMVEKYREI